MSAQTNHKRRCTGTRVCISTCLVLLAMSCGQPSHSDQAFATAEVKIAPLIDSVLATGRVHTVQSVDVSSQLSGRIDEVYVDFNDIVEEGQPLARLDPLRFESRVEELTAALAIAKAELLSVEAAIDGAEAKFEEDDRDYRRKQDLMKRGSVSDSEVSRARALRLQSQSGLQTLQASKAVSNANIAAASASLRQAQIDLDRTMIRAPIAGMVIKRSIEPGQTVAVSLSAPELFTIANDLNEIEVHARVDEADVGKVQVGQTVAFTVDAHPGRRVDGAVSQIRKAPEISQNVVSYSVVISAPNPDQLMLPGMTALVEITTARKDQVLQVPNAALRFNMPTNASLAAPELDDPLAGDALVWVRSGAGHKPETLETGYSDGEYTEVRSGNIAAGDQVVVGYRR